MMGSETGGKLKPKLITFSDIFSRERKISQDCELISKKIGNMLMTDRVTRILNWTFFFRAFA